MSGATFGRLKNWGDEILTNEDLNDEIDNILENFTPQGLDDYSVNAAQMKLQTSPGGLGTESLAVSTAGELERLRYVIARIIFGDGVSTRKWYEEGVSSIQDLFDTFQAAQISSFSGNRIASGRKSANSSKLMALVPVGNQPQVTLKAGTTPFVYFVEGNSYTISSDVSVTVGTAPVSNNTAVAMYTPSTQGDLTSADEQLKYLGEYDTPLNLISVGSSITSRIQRLVALLPDSNDEIIVGTLRAASDIGSTTNTHELINCRRGAFFDNLDFPLVREYFATNHTMTMLELSFIFAKTDLTLDSSTRLHASGTVQPASATSGDYWFDTSLKKWFKYNGAAWAAANAILIGYAASNTSNCIAARTLDAEAIQSDQNSVRIQQDVNKTIVYSAGGFEQIVVNGQKITFQDAPLTFDPTLDMANGVNYSASTTYYLYITETGGRKISDIGPHDRRSDLLGWYHPSEMWRCVGQFYSNASSECVAQLSIDGDDCPKFEITQNWVSASSTNTLMFHAPPSRAFRMGSTYVSNAIPKGERMCRVPGLLRLNLAANAACGRTLITPGIFGSGQQPPMALYLVSTGHCGPLLGLSPAADFDTDNTVLSSTTSGFTSAIYVKAPSANNVGRKIPVGILTGGASSAFWDQAFTSITPLTTDNAMAVLTAIAKNNWSPFGTGALWMALADNFSLSTSGYASLEYAQLSNNSIILPEGTYEVEVDALWTGADALQHQAQAVMIGSVNGNNTTTVPDTVGITPLGTNDNINFPAQDNYVSIRAGVATTIFPLGKLYFRAQTRMQVFLNTKVVFATAGSGAFRLRGKFRKLDRAGS